VLLVVFCVSIALSVVLIWARNQINDTDRYVRTVSPLAADPAIQNAIVTAITDRFSARLDEAATRDILSDRQRYLAAPLNALLTDFVENTTRSIVTSDQFAQYWVEINRAAHPAVSALLTGESTENMTTANGKVTVDLAPIVAAVSTVLNEHGIDLFDRDPGGRVNVSIVLVDSPDLAEVQGTVDRLESLALVFPILALLAVAGYLWLSTDRRQGVIWAGLGLAAAMAVLLLLLSFARSRYLQGLSSDVNRDAATAFFDTVGRYLRGSARLLTALGLLVAGVAAATRPDGWVSRQRAALGRRLAMGRPETEGRWSWLDQTWVARHSAELLGVLIAVCCIAVVAPGHITQGWGRTVTLVAAVGLVAIWLLSRSTVRQSPAPAAIGLGAAGADGVVATVAVKHARGGQPVGNQTDAAPTMETGAVTLPDLTQDLSAEDLKVLHRVAAALRESGRSSESRSA
jgi:hypothetical protein